MKKTVILNLSEEVCRWMESLPGSPAAAVERFLMREFETERAALARLRDRKETADG